MLSHANPCSTPSPLAITPSFRLCSAYFRPSPPVRIRLCGEIWWSCHLRGDEPETDRSRFRSESCVEGLKPIMVLFCRVDHCFHVALEPYNIRLLYMCMACPNAPLNVKCVCDRVVPFENVFEVLSFCYRFECVRRSFFKVSLRLWVPRPDPARTVYISKWPRQATKTAQRDTDSLSGGHICVV